MSDSRKPIRRPSPRVKPVGAWVEMSGDGKPLFCYHGRRDGRRFEQKLTLEEIAEFLHLWQTAENISC